MWRFVLQVPIEQLQIYYFWNRGRKFKNFTDKKFCYQSVGCSLTSITININVICHLWEKGSQFTDDCGQFQNSFPMRERKTEFWKLKLRDQSPYDGIDRDLPPIKIIVILHLREIDFAFADDLDCFPEHAGAQFRVFWLRRGPQTLSPWSGNGLRSAIWGPLQYSFSQV